MQRDEFVASGLGSDCQIDSVFGSSSLFITAIVEVIVVIGVVILVVVVAIVAIVT